jgi:hypothetical protein
MGDFFNGYFLKTTKVAQLFGDFFHGKGYAVIFSKYGIGQHFFVVVAKPSQNQLPHRRNSDSDRCGIFI